MKCIAIDDEPFALELISDYIRKTPFLEFVEGFTNPFHAMEFLLKNEVDLLFLDINMPELSGVELLKSLPNTPKVIFTTAYSEFGAESYDFNTIDYLLKPIRYDRFLKAVNKANDNNASTKKNVATIHTPDQDKESIRIKSGTQLIQVIIDDIYFIEGAGNYLTLHTKNKKIMILLTMVEIGKILPSHLFVRIHKSFIVALKHIEIIEKARVIVNKKVIPVGITYREHFSKIINNG